MDAFLHNCWYVAAWDDEVAVKPLARTLLDTPVMLFRKADGAACALLDRCPHRFVPLSRGTVRGDSIICGYHGLVFHVDGSCTDQRCSPAAQARARVRAFPVVERHGLVWIWMGDPAHADASRISDFGFFDREGHRRVSGYTHVKSHYLLEVDNLMDLSHIDHVHRDTISGGVMAGARHEVRQQGSTVHSNTLCASVPCLPNFEPYVRAAGRPTDHWLDMRWDAPGVMQLDIGVALADAPRESGHQILQGHFLTPETAGTTHYFWGLSRADHGEPEGFDDMLRDITRRAFEEEDRPMIEAAQQRMRGNDFWAEKPVILAADAGAIRARQVLEKLLAEERPGVP